MGERHETFRTGFTRDAHGVWTRTVDARSRFGLVCEDLSHHGDAAESIARVRAAEALRTPFDRARAPLLVPTLYTLAPGRWWMLYKADHVAFDGIAFAVILGEILATYLSLRRGEDPELPPPPQPRAHVTALDARLAPLRDAPPPWHTLQPVAGFSLPADPTRPDTDDPAGGRVPFVLGDPDALDALARARHVSRAAPYLVAMAAGLRAVSQRDDVGLTLIRSGRRDDEARAIAGCLAWGDAWHVTLDARDTWAEALARADAFLRDDAPWRMLYIPAVDPPTRRIVLNINRFETALELPGLRATPVADLALDVAMWSSHDLLLQVFPLPGVVFAVARYRLSRFEPSTLAKLTAAMSAAVAAMTADADAPVGPTP